MHNRVTFNYYYFSLSNFKYFHMNAFALVINDDCDRCNRAEHILVCLLFFSRCVQICVCVNVNIIYIIFVSSFFPCISSIVIIYRAYFKWIKWTLNQCNFAFVINSILPYFYNHYVIIILVLLGNILYFNQLLIRYTIF